MGPAPQTSHSRVESCSGSRPPPGFTLQRARMWAIPRKVRERRPQICLHGVNPRRLIDFSLDFPSLPLSLLLVFYPSWYVSGSLLWLLYLPQTSLIARCHDRQVIPISVFRPPKNAQLGLRASSFDSFAKHQQTRPPRVVLPELSRGLLNKICQR